MSNVSDTLMILAVAKVKWRQQVAECSTAMEHPLSQVTTTVCVCVSVRVRLHFHESEPKPDSNHQDCATCVCHDSDSNCSSIFAPVLIEVWWAVRRLLKPLASSEMDIRCSLMRLSSRFRGKKGKNNCSFDVLFSSFAIEVHLWGKLEEGFPRYNNRQRARLMPNSIYYIWNPNTMLQRVYIKE